MNFYVLTLFPEMIQQGLGTSITGRALEKGTISLEAVNIRDYAENKHHKVDDYPYGGGAGMVMQAAPVYGAYEAVKENMASPPRVVYLTPQGQVFHQKMAEELAREENLVFLCGHYEGIDQRIIDIFNPIEISIGDYVLTGGELPSMVMIDAISRYVDGVIAKESLQEESISSGTLEYPQYTRPADFMGYKVPDVLLSGNHQEDGLWAIFLPVISLRYKSHQQSVHNA